MTSEQEKYINSVVDTLVFEARQSMDKAEAMLNVIANMLPYVQDYYKPYLTQAADIIAEIVQNQDFDPNVGNHTAEQLSAGIDV